MSHDSKEQYVLEKVFYILDTNSGGLKMTELISKLGDLFFEGGNKHLIEFLASDDFRKLLENEQRITVFDYVWRQKGDVNMKNDELYREKQFVATTSPL